MWANANQVFTNTDHKAKHLKCVFCVQMLNHFQIDRVLWQHFYYQFTFTPGLLFYNNDIIAYLKTLFLCKQL